MTTATRVPGRPLAPPPSDLEQVMSTEEPLVTRDRLDGGQGVEAAFAGTAARWTSPEAVRAGANHVRHVGVPKRTLYDALGSDRQVAHTDVPMLVDEDLPADRRLYIRCPKCVDLENRGIHEFTGPNSCPGLPKRKYTVCDVCASGGRRKRIFEDVAPADGAALAVEEDGALYVAPRLGTEADRDARLQLKLEDHVVAFHRTEARQRGLIKTERELGRR